MIPSLFPHLFDYSLLAATILRLALGISFAHLAYTHFTKHKTAYAQILEMLGFRIPHTYAQALAILEGVAGTLLILGIYTQGAALLGAFLALVTIVATFRKPHGFPEGARARSALLMIIALALLFLGPGILAFDIYL